MPTIQFLLAEESALLTRLRNLGVLRWVPRALTYQVIVASLIAWLPLLIFTAPEGLAAGTKVQVPFLADMVQYARFLVALPIAIAAGKFINPRIENVLNALLRSRIVSGEEIPRLEGVVSQAKALKNSIIAEGLILALVYLYTYLGLQRGLPPDMSSWNQLASSSSILHAAAVRWFLWVSMPLLLFFWFRWVWRFGVWAYVLLRISRLNLHIVATHPDSAGGLNFLNVAHRRFSVLVFAISSVLSASIAEEIVVKKTLLTAFEPELAAFFAICLAITLGPLLVFSPPLNRARLKYWGYYSPFASRYVQGFDEKWILNEVTSAESALGSPDIQSLADLRNSYAGIAQMRTFLPGRRTVAVFAMAYVLPLLPLLTSVIPLRQVLSEIYRLLLK